MAQTNPQEHIGGRNMRDCYAQLGLQPGAAMRDIEAAYWRFARELRGQPAMAPYTAAYEALVNRVTPRPNAASPAPSETPTQPALPPEKSTPVSKFGWPAS